MADPRLARKDDEDRRFYVFGEPLQSFWSVTTLISGGVPKHLQAHYAKLAAELAYDAILERGPYSRPGAIVNRLAARGRAHVVERQTRGELKSIKLAKLTQRDLALRWIKGAADRHRDAAAQRGTDIHGKAEDFVLAYARESTRLVLEGLSIEPWPAEIVGWQPALLTWIDDFNPEFLLSEATVFNRREIYAGTLDTVVRITFSPAARRAWSDIFPVLLERDWLIVLVDYKSGNDIYAEVALQLSAYRRGEFIGHPDAKTELPMPDIDATAVLHLRANGTYGFQFIRSDQPVYDTFLYAREVFRFRDQLAKTVFLGEMAPMPIEIPA